MHSVVGHSAGQCSHPQNTHLNAAAEVCTGILADGAGMGVEKKKKTGKEKNRAMFNKSVVFGWEISTEYSAYGLKCADSRTSSSMSKFWE